jgi:hypothetical protein
MLGQASRMSSFEEQKIWKNAGISLCKVITILASLGYTPGFLDSTFTNQNFQSHLASPTSHTANTHILKDGCYLELCVSLAKVFLFVQALVERKPQADIVATQLQYGNQAIETRICCKAEVFATGKIIIR